MNRHAAINSGHIERWLSAERAEHLSKSMRGWYGPPIKIIDMPGDVFLNGDGEFSGGFERGRFFSALDSLESHVRAVRRRLGRVNLGDPNTLHAGFASLDAAISAMSGGKRQLLAGGNIQIVGTAGGTTAACVDLGYPGNNPGAGAAGAAAPGGTAGTDATTGAMKFENPTGGEYTLLVGADMMSSVAAMSCMLYDRIFSVTKTMASTATEAVTGTPARYQSTTATNPDYIGGNFAFVSCRTVLPATAHNWTVCQYTNQSGTGTANFPSVTGISSCAANRLDMPVGQWFMPLVSGDVGVQKITQMQCSASVATGAIDFNIGHPIGIMSFPLANFIYPFDWLTNRDLCPRIFDDACLALLQLPISANSATTFTGNIYVGQG